ncbi:hypothetical protein SEA_ADGERS_61 [Gordonia phage Adgers]|uniref:Uncharacterized protein n=5 Tax=Montyvirus TaxID=2733196 RepID=A0A2L1IVG3_9CAUD|nr:hypothetical protein HOS75_gp071 [Gordonia phage SteveFrench]YP_009837027.1 hypothetical protein HWB50_gp073 [Gordonia phage Adgers]AVD99567.1 hypothetical protein SEA_BONEHAM_62 [Gordonia phage Boneham]QAY16986.1 hypothetical protein SEA_BUTTERBALL_61 [Gordonia phage Butterball]QRI45642.1 hypothetical protein SEA_ROYALG_58 [Gordonia phage RoyalG]AUV60659.1 hypothetical protein SEA_STEVEFRENCH_57 [Gordonia phage SteveFrench]AVD99156.1 hypothetical protein SEA_ADGERS_61 [Gordonia phage Adge
MIRTVLVNVGKLFEDRNKRVLDLFEQRLIDLAVDSRAQLAVSKAQLADVTKNSQSAVKINQATETYQAHKATVEAVDGLIGDLNAIMQRVHAGA